MILILSDQADQVTNYVIDWINYKKIPFKRINSRDIFENTALIANTINLSKENPYVKLAERSSCVWLRRWFDILDMGFSQDPTLTFAEYQVKQGILNEFSVVTQYFFQSLIHKKWLTTPKGLIVNKLNVLNVALQVGLDIPETLITTDKDTLCKFKEKHRQIITKAIHEPRSIPFKGSHFSTFTVTVSQQDIDELEKMPMSLFQECLDKEFEIRTFYLDKKCYSMAIFSQRDEQTKVDFRAYNHDKPNRRVPYQLDQSIELLIQQLMTKLDLQTGSLDFVKTKDNRIVFLEVNPVGQFGMVSLPCNYFLEEILVNYLTNLGTCNHSNNG